MKTQHNVSPSLSESENNLCHYTGHSGIKCTLNTLHSAIIYTKQGVYSRAYIGSHTHHTYNVWWETFLIVFNNIMTDSKAAKVTQLYTHLHALLYV